MASLILTILGLVVVVLGVLALLGAIHIGIVWWLLLIVGGGLLVLAWFLRTPRPVA